MQDGIPWIKKKTTFRPIIALGSMEHPCSLNLPKPCTEIPWKTWDFQHCHLNSPFFLAASLGEMERRGKVGSGAV